MINAGVFSGLRSVAASISGLSRPIKQALLLVADIVTLSVCLLAALLLKNGSLPEDESGLLISIGVAVGAGVASFALLGLYRSMVRFLSSRDTLALVSGVGLSSVVAMPVSISAALPAASKA